MTDFGRPWRDRRLPQTVHVAQELAHDTWVRRRHVVELAGVVLDVEEAWQGGAGGPAGV